MENVQETAFFPAPTVVAGRDFHRVTDVAYLNETDAFDNATTGHVQARQSMKRLPSMVLVFMPT